MAIRSINLQKNTAMNCVFSNSLTNIFSFTISIASSSSRLSASSSHSNTAFSSFWSPKITNNVFLYLFKLPSVNISKYISNHWIYYWILTIISQWVSVPEIYNGWIGFDSIAFCKWWVIYPYHMNSISVTLIIWFEKYI